MASLVEINVLLDAAVVAIEASNWVLARTKLMAASVLIAGRPDNQKDGLQLRYERSSIQNMIDQVNKMIASEPATGGGLGQTPVTYIRPTT